MGLLLAILLIIFGLLNHNEEKKDVRLSGSEILPQPVSGSVDVDRNQHRGKTICTSTINTTYFIYSNGTVDLCSNILTYCSLCTSQTQCTTCVNTSYTLQTTGSGVGCALCSAFMAGCLRCSDNGTCTQCDTASNWVLTLGQCVCISGLYEWGELPELWGRDCWVFAVFQQFGLCVVSHTNMYVSISICVCNFGYFLNTSNIFQSCS
jgi:hypothetical protein